MEIRDAVWDVFWDYINDVWEKYSDKERGWYGSIDLKDVENEFILPEFDTRFCMDYVPLRRHLDEENFSPWFLDMLYKCDDYEPDDPKSFKKVLDLLNDEDFYVEVAEEFFDDDEMFENFKFGWDDEVEGYVLKYIGD